MNINKFYCLIVFFLGLCIIANAQEKPEILTEQSAIELVKTKSVDINNAQLNIRNQKANIEGAFNIGTLQFDYRKVPFTASGETEMTLTQNFGSILGHFKRLKLAKSQVALAKATTQITEKQVIRNVRNLYQQWHYLYSLKKLLDDQQTKINEIQNFAKKQHEVGEIGGLEKDMITMQSLSIKTQKSSITRDFFETENKLKALLQLKKIIKPEDKFPKLLFVNFSEKTSTVFDDAFQKSYRIAENNVSVAKSVYFPEVYGSIVRMKDGNNPNYTGFGFGLQIPFPLGSSNANIRQQKINREQVAFYNQSAKTEIELRKESLEYQLKEMQNKINAISTTFNQAEKFLEKLEIAYKTGEIGTYEYNQSFASYFEVMQNYLSLINTYNQIAIEYQYYVE
ncbi:MAG: TolC family protein [Tenacibaculum sp.]|nr:TolC family protein [Tenacibaculum sp.]